MATDDPDVFVSYTSADRSVAEEVYRSLSRSGFRCWMAPNDITPGEKYPRAIVRAISSVQVFVLIYSAAANQSSHVQGEVSQAFNRNLPILPFRIENVKPSEDLEYFLGNYHWFDAFDRPWQEQLDELSIRVRRLVQRSPRADVDRGPIRTEPAGFDSVVRDPAQLCGTKIGSYVLQAPLGCRGQRPGLQDPACHLGADCLRQAVLSCPCGNGPRLGCDETWPARFGRPNVIRIIDEGTAAIVGAQVVYLAMDLIAGVDLLSWTRSLPNVREQDPQAFVRRLHVARQIVLGMQTAHECRFLDDVGFEQTGVLHGDLKPANILIRADDSPVLLDFPICRLAYVT